MSALLESYDIDLFFYHVFFDIFWNYDSSYLKGGIESMSITEAFGGDWMLFIVNISLKYHNSIEGTFLLYCTIAVAT